MSLTFDIALVAEPPSAGSAGPALANSRARGLAGLLGYVRRRRNAFATQRSRRPAIDRLYALRDTQLTDIGLQRAQIELNFRSARPTLAAARPISTTRS